MGWLSQPNEQVFINLSSPDLRLYTNQMPVKSEVEIVKA